MSPEVVADLAPTGVLRAAINTGNALLVTGRARSGDPKGVAPDLAREIASRLGVPVQYIPFSTPSELADAATAGRWDIGLIGAEPERARNIDFTAPYVEIEAAYLVPAGSPIQTVAGVDQPGVRVAFSAGSAYGLWLDRNIAHATLAPSSTINGAQTAFLDDGLDVLAGLRPGLQSALERLPAGGRILAGRFMTVQQAVGTPKGRDAGLAFLTTLVEDAKASGLIARLLDRHGVSDRLSVSPPAS